MTTKTFSPARSERGIALIVVLLLLAVISSLAAGLTMNSQVEIAMATNEAYYAGSRAAAEAGMNRAIEAITADTSHNLLKGQDGLVDLVTPGAAVNSDNGKITYMLAGASPYGLDAKGKYTYTIQIYDDDDPSLYTSALSAAQLAAMGEDGNSLVNVNDRLILRATGLGPNGTTVRVARILESVDTAHSTTTTTTTLTNPAILIDGSLTISGNINVSGSSGSVHANSNLAINGNSASVSQNATASGTFSANNNWHSGAAQGGGRPTVTVPNIVASNYSIHANRVLTSTGQVLSASVVNGVLVTGAAVAGTGWTYGGGTNGTWTNNSNSATAGTFYSAGTGTVTVSGSPGSSKSPLAMSIIAMGSINISGHPYFQPQNAARLQFVTNKDLSISGAIDIDQTVVEGQILVREQISISGNPDLRGQIIVQNVASTSNLVTTNTISGSPHVTYDGTFGAIATTIVTDVTLPTTYVNNVSGWMES